MHRVEEKPGAPPAGGAGKPQGTKPQTKPPAADAPKPGTRAGAPAPKPGTGPQPASAADTQRRQFEQAWYTDSFTSTPGGRGPKLG